VQAVAEAEKDRVSSTMEYQLNSRFATWTTRGSSMFFKKIHKAEADGSPLQIAAIKVLSLHIKFLMLLMK
jgi:hypothetical protein